MLRKLAAVASVSALLMGGSLAVAGSASADTVYFVAVSGAEADFYPTGEVLYTYDTAADGHHAVTYYRTSNNSTVRSLADYNGNGTHTSVNLSIPETGWIDVDVCVAEGSTLLRCSGYYRFSAAN